MNSLTIFMIILVLAIDFSLAFECSGCGKVKLLQMVSCRHYFCNTCRNKITQCNMCKEYFKIGNSENTTGVNLLKCSNCSEVYKLRVSSCSHIHCNYCISNLLGCTICKINFSDAQILTQILTCSICSLPNILYEENNKIYCTSCQSLGFVSQETTASSSRQNYGNDLIGEDLSRCVVCSNKNLLYQLSCSHFYCYTCLRYLTHCRSCGKDITNSSIPQELRVMSSRQNLVPQETGASSSRQNNVPLQFGVPPFNQNNVPPQFGVPPFNQYNVPLQFGVPPFNQNNVPPQFGVPPFNQNNVPPQFGVPPFNQSSVPSVTEAPTSNQSVPSEAEDPPSNQCDDTEGSNRPPIFYNFFP